MIESRLDLLLVFPPLSLKRGLKKTLGRSGGNLAPLGIATLAGFVREKGFTVAILDCSALSLSVEEALEEIAKLKPRAVGFSVTTYVYPMTAELARGIRVAEPNILTIIGGGHANIQHVSPLQEQEGFDLLCFDEGELTLWEILEAYKACGFDRRRLLEDESSLAKIQGMTFRRAGGSLQENPRRPWIPDLDVLPMPARDLLPMDRYLPFPMYYRNLPVHNMVVTRGCPFACTFCDQGVLSNFRGRSRSPAKAVEEMKILIDQYGAKEISFWDDTLTYNKRWIREFCTLVEKEKLGVDWNCYAAIKTVDPESLALMKRAGCWKIYYGIETGNEDLMKHIKIDRKNGSLDLIRETLGWTRDAGIETHCSFMLGVPGETPEKAQKTIDFAVELDPDYAQFSITTTYPGTELYADLEKFGKLTTRDWRDYHGWEAVFLPFGYESTLQLKTMEKWAYKSFFLRTRYIMKKILAIRSWLDIKRYYHGFRILTDCFLLRDPAHGFNVR